MKDSSSLRNPNSPKNSKKSTTQQGLSSLEARLKCKQRSLKLKARPNKYSYSNRSSIANHKNCYASTNNSIMFLKLLKLLRMSLNLLQAIMSLILLQLTPFRLKFHHRVFSLAGSGSFAVVSPRHVGRIPDVESGGREEWELFLIKIGGIISIGRTIIIETESISRTIPMGDFPRRK